MLSEWCCCVGVEIFVTLDSWEFGLWLWMDLFSYFSILVDVFCVFWLLVDVFGVLLDVFG